MRYLKCMSAKHWSSTGENGLPKEHFKWLSDPSEVIPRGWPQTRKNISMACKYPVGNLAACDWTYTNSPRDRFTINLTCIMESWEREIYLNQFKTEWNDHYDVGVSFVLSEGLQRTWRLISLCLLLQKNRQMRKTFPELDAHSVSF